MKAKFRILVVILVLTTFLAEAKATPRGKLRIDPAPTIGAGSITAQGSYNAQPRWNPEAVKLFALPMNGGLQAATKAAAPEGNQWGPLTVGNLAPGQYAVYALMDLTKGGVTEIVCSDASIVTVVDEGRAPPAPAGTVTHAEGDPTTGAGSVSVTNKGTYEIAKRGFKATACGLAVVPFAGGEFPTAYTKKGSAPAGGNWGPITIDKLPKGQYLVVGQVTMTDGKTDQTIQSPVNLLIVQ